MDVDGTLVGADNTVPEAVWREAALCREQGMHLALCTGRPAFGDTLVYAKRLSAGGGGAAGGSIGAGLEEAPQGFHIFQNGASLLAVGQEGEQGLGQELPAGALSLLRACAEPDDLLEWYSDTAYSLNQCSAVAVQHAELLGVSLPEPELEFERVVRAQWVVSERRAEELMALAYPDLALHPASSPRMPGVRFVSVTRAGVSKGAAVLALCERLGISPKSAMMVGDGANDVSALEVVGHPVAMGNAEEPAKAASRYEVAAVSQGGLAQALRLARQLSA